MQYITPNWPAPSNVCAVSTTRKNGNSLSPYSSLNLGQHVGDDSQTVIKNRQLLANCIQLPSEPIWLQQVHSNTAMQINGMITPNLVADAAITTVPNCVCVVLTADCLPILICNQTGTKVAAIHAGWRGLSKNIVENTIEMMNEDPTKLYVWLGPAIGPEKFEVSDDVVQIFTNQTRLAKSSFHPIPNRAGKYLANIYMLAKIRLNALGITHVYGGDFCTYLDEKNFYSYRRDQGLTGRMATLIWLSA